MLFRSYELCRTNLVCLNAISAPTPQQFVVEQLVRLCSRCGTRRLSRRSCAHICCSCRCLFNLIKLCRTNLLCPKATYAPIPLQYVVEQRVRFCSRCRARRLSRRSCQVQIFVVRAGAFSIFCRTRIFFNIGVTPLPTYPTRTCPQGATLFTSTF